MRADRIALCLQFAPSLVKLLASVFASLHWSTQIFPRYLMRLGIP
jgi:hypothetical protein